MASSALNIRLLPETLRSVAGASFTGSYQVIGTPLAHPARIVKFTNTSGVDALVSWDGTNAHDIVPAGGFLLLDVTANQEPVAGQLSIGSQTQFYFLATASTGSMYLSVYYAV